MEEANRLPPVFSSRDDSVDKSTGSVAGEEEFPEDFRKLLPREEEFPEDFRKLLPREEEFPEDFRKLLHTELNSSRLVGEAHVTGWVFWSRRDDRISTVPPPVSDRENVNIIPDCNPKVKDKIRLALGKILLHPRYGQSLVQFWSATEMEGRTMLTTQNQPFALGNMGRSTWGLCKYRMKSLEYKFYGDIGKSGEELGLPGRVFLYKLPESASDVRYYSLKEYPQRDDASRCQVRASWALPVFEHSNQVCVGVLELVSAVNAIADWHDKSFLHNLYDVLQELGLQSVDVHRHNEMKKDEDKALTTAFHELSLVLESVCKSHNLPLALTWVRCNACDTLLLGQCSSEGGEYLGVFMANDDHLVDFLIASTGYHLRKGQVAGRVLAFPKMLYCSDITQLSIAEYPLVLFARQCKLSGWFTICLHSSYTGEVVYKLEFFFPTSSKYNENTLTTVSAILGTMKANSKTFKLASGEELGEALSIEVLDFQNFQRLHHVHEIQASLELLKNGGLTLQMSSVIGVDDGKDVISTKQNEKVSTISEGCTTKTQERELKKTGVRFDISLDDILRFSAWSRKDAARGLKVSESTLKRVCRKHGIHRWPPRDINKEEVFALALPNVGDTVHLNSPKELELDATLNGSHDVGLDLCWPSRSFIGAECSNSDGTCSGEGAITPQKRKKGKTGVRIEIPLDDILQYSKMKIDDAARELNVSSSTLKRICRDYGIHRWPPRKIDKVGAPQPSRDVPLHNIDKLGATQTPLVVSQEGISQLTSDMPSNQALDSRDNRIHLGPPQNINKVGAPQPSHVEHEEGISLLTSDMHSNQVSDGKGYGIQKRSPHNVNKVGSSRPLGVENEEGISLLTSDMLSNQVSNGKGYGTRKWPPRNVNKVGSSRPSRVEQQDGTSVLTSDTHSNQVSASVACMKPRDAAFQEMEVVTIKAKYSEYTMKFQLSMPPRMLELHQEVDKRLKLEHGTYCFNYKDDDGDFILIACEEDLLDCIHSSRSKGNTTVPIVILHHSK